MIQSFLVELAPDENGHVFVVFDTIFEHRRVATACGVGRMERGEVLLTPVAQATLNALAAYTGGDNAGAVHLVEVATVAAAPIRVRKALKAADDKDAVFFVCRNPQVYDAVVLQLNPAAADSTELQ